MKEPSFGTILLEIACVLLIIGMATSIFFVSPEEKALFYLQELPLGKKVIEYDEGYTHITITIEKTAVVKSAEEKK